jgi:arylsulfatase A-like enzyme
MNVLLLAVDSLRADHMSCYGYPRLTTPHIDRLADQGVLFEDTFSANIPTTPAYAAMLTGRDLISTQVVSLRHKEPIAESIPLLPEILREHGYVSACVGFDEGLYRGFDRYANYRAWMDWEGRPGDKAHQLNEVAIPILNNLAAGDAPFFLFLRHMDPHAPYLPPSPFDRMFYDSNERDPNNQSMEPVFAFAPFAEFFKSWMPPGVTDAEYIIAQYDGALAYMDACIARIFTRLEELGMADSTLVILNGDHGETLYDHNCFFDHHGLYEPTLHVPLIIRHPKLPAGHRVRGFNLHIDLVPTILELLELDADYPFDGQSVVPMIRGERPANYDEFYITECTWMRKHGWRTPHWKLIEALEPDFHDFPPVELYNLVSDPGENHNLADEEPQMVQTLRGRMQRWLDKRCAETGKGVPIHDWHLGLDLKIGSIKKAEELQKK